MRTTYRMREAAARAERKHEAQSAEITALTTRVQELSSRVTSLEADVASLLVSTGYVVEVRPVMPKYVKQPVPVAARPVRRYGLALKVG